jgi:uncharacterized RDD family membrane protein YckC
MMSTGRHVPEDPRATPEAPEGAPSANGATADRVNRPRSAHAAAAARAQAAAAARAAGNADARSAPAGTEAERTGAYAGLVTRAIAYAVDAAVINLAALLVGVVVALALSLLHRVPDDLKAVVAAILAVVYVLWAIGYFVTFWSTTGQTLGQRVMRIRVIDARGDAKLTPRRALVRVLGLGLATIPLFAGFVMMLWDDRRRCLQDRLARTVVVHAPPQARIVRRGIPREPA